MTNLTITLMENGWFCPQCQELIEHKKRYINRRLYLECSGCHTKFKAPQALFMKYMNRRNGHKHGVKNQKYLSRSYRPCLRCGKPYLVGPNGFHKVCAEVFTLAQALSGVNRIEEVRKC